VSAAPYQAQHSYCPKPPGGDSFNQERRCQSSLMIVVRGGMTEKDIKPPEKKKANKERWKSKSRGVMSMHVCVPLKLQSNSITQPNCTFASPEKPLTLSAYVQDEIQTNFLLFSPPIYFLNRCSGFYFIIQDLQKETKQKKPNIFLQPN